MNMARHDSDFAFAGTDNSGTVWTNQSGSFVVKIFPHLHHIERRNAFGNANHYRNACVSSFHDRIGGECRRHVDHRRVGTCLLNRVGDGVEYRNAFMRSPTFAGRDTANNIRSVLNHLFSMKRTFFPVSPCTTSRVDLSTKTLNV